MSKLYRDKRWIEFREQVFELDGYACTKCNREMPEVVLQVHHKEYQPGKPPWDYPTGLCETLCKGCHAREHGEIRPNEGWNLNYEEDLGGLYGECECCGKSIRYVFLIHHTHWEPMSVGTVCCDNLTGTTEATQFRKRLDRKRRFLKSSRWQESSRGSSIKENKLEIDIILEGNKYRIYMNKVRGKRVFGTIESAKYFVFDSLEEGTAQAYFEKHGRLG